ncbi:MAG TPA: hypothetical protein VGJ82_05480, partial [Thermoanaerobaculia bacterium]
MNKPRLVPGLLVVLVILCVVAAYAAAPAAKKAPAGPTDAQLIVSAMSAAPAGIGKAATIVNMTADGKMRTLRPGSNGWT